MSVTQNNLSSLNFRFMLKHIPNVQYRVQKANLPGMQLGVASVPTPFVKIPLTGNLTYDTFSVEFLVGEDMDDYLEIFNWMVKLGYPDQLGQFEETITDATLMILNNSFRPNMNVKFTRVFPVALSDVNFDLTLEGIQFAKATATFKFERFYIEKDKPLD